MEGGGQWKEWADYCLLDNKGRRPCLIEPPKQLLEKAVYFPSVVQTFELVEEPNCLACVEAAEISAASNDNEVIGKGIRNGNHLKQVAKGNQSAL